MQKPWYWSSVDEDVALRIKALVPLVFPLVTFFLRYFGVEINETQFTDLVNGLLVLISIALVIYGQWRAKREAS